MPVSTIKVDVDGHKVEVTQFMAVRGIKLKARLYKLALPVIAVVFKDAGKVKDVMEATLDLPVLIQTAASSLDPDVFFQLLLDLLSSTTVDGQGVDQHRFDDLFVGNYFFAYKIAAEVIKANGFFEIGSITGLLTNMQ